MGAIFNGYFSVDNTTNIIQQFFNSNNIGINILAVTADDYGADYKFVNNDFTDAGTTITSIPALNAIYGAIEWSLWIANKLSYKNSNNIWIDLPTEEFIYTFAPTVEPISNICFPAGTPITCDQGNIPIEHLNPKVHTIRGKKLSQLLKLFLLISF